MAKVGEHVAIGAVAVLRPERWKIAVATSSAGGVAGRAVLPARRPAALGRRRAEPLQRLRLAGRSAALPRPGRATGGRRRYSSVANSAPEDGEARSAGRRGLA